MNTQQKRKLLKAILSGNTDGLKEHKANLPPLFTAEQLALRRQYFTELFGRVPDERMMRHYWGLYDLARWKNPDRPLIGIKLSNDILLYTHDIDGRRYL